MGLRVLAVDTGAQKRDLCMKLGAEAWIDFKETKDLVAGWMIVDVDSYERAVELTGGLSAAPGAGGEPIHEWIELRPFLEAPPTVTE